MDLMFLNIRRLHTRGIQASACSWTLFSYRLGCVPLLCDRRRPMSSRRDCAYLNSVRTTFVAGL